MTIRSLTGREYRLIRPEASGGLALNQLVYTDREYVYTSVPQSLQNAIYIMTANDDKWSLQNDALLEIRSNKRLQIYIAYSDAFPARTNWLQAYTDTGENLVFQDKFNPVNLSLYAQIVPAGSTIVLFGNRPNESEDHTMYTVVLKVLE